MPVRDKKGIEIGLLPKRLSRIEHVEAKFLEHGAQCILKPAGSAEADLMIGRDKKNRHRHMMFPSHAGQVAEQKMEIALQRFSDSLIKLARLKVRIAALLPG